MCGSPKFSSEEDQPMFYLGIDQHRKQLTVCLRDEAGSVILQRQVSTEWQRVRSFFEQLAERCRVDGGYVAVVEVCGFNDWLLKLLPEYGCGQVILVQAEDRGRQKTDYRDASQLSEQLWINRQRFLSGQRIHGLRQVWMPPADRRAQRQLCGMRRRLGAERTRLLNRIQRILRKHNLQQECPTKGIATKTASRWLTQLPLPAVDRQEMDATLAQYTVLAQQLLTLETEIRQQAQQDENSLLIATLYGGSPGYAALALAASIGPIDRFPRPRSLANYWGLTPRCRNSGEATQRLGSITKQGSAIARFLLCQLVQRALRRDAWLRQWYKRIKQRRGTKIARVAVMRRLATIIWHMLKHREPYQLGGRARRYVATAT
jgi:transposase